MYGYWGHWALLGLYALLVLLVSKLFSAFKVGYMRILDVILSQIFSVLLVNIFEYFQLSLIGHWKFLTNLEPMLRVTGVNLILVVLWVVFMRLTDAKSIRRMRYWSFTTALERISFCTSSQSEKTSIW